MLNTSGVSSFLKGVLFCFKKIQKNTRILKYVKRESYCILLYVIHGPPVLSILGPSPRRRAPARPWRSAPQHSAPARPPAPLPPAPRRRAGRGRGARGRCRACLQRACVDGHVSSQNSCLAVTATQTQMQGLKLPHIQLEQINHTHANLLDVRLIISGKRMSNMSHTFREIYGSSASKN